MYGVLWVDRLGRFYLAVYIVLSTKLIEYIQKGKLSHSPFCTSFIRIQYPIFILVSKNFYSEPKKVFKKMNYFLWTYSVLIEGRDYIELYLCEPHCVHLLLLIISMKVSLPYKLGCTMEIRSWLSRSNIISGVLWNRLFLYWLIVCNYEWSPLKYQEDLYCLSISFLCILFI